MNNPRAKQFMPFDALKGFKEAIKERQRIIVSKKELTLDDIDNLNYKFTQIKKGKVIKVIHYNKGDYVETTGILTKLNTEDRILTIVKTKIKFDDILDISGDEINSLY